MSFSFFCSIAPRRSLSPSLTDETKPPPQLLLSLCSCSPRLGRALPRSSDAALRRNISASAAAAVAAAGDSSSSSSKKPKKKPTKILASDPEEVALRPAAPLAAFSVGGSSADAVNFEGGLLVLGLFEEDLVQKEEDKDEEEESRACENGGNQNGE